jgi:pimeloyl-ACP methyl ester carboxylesterase
MTNDLKETPDQRPTSIPQRPVKWKRWLKGLVFIYVGYVALMYFAQRSVIFPGQYRPAPPPIRLSEGMEQVWIEHDGAKVEVLLLAPLPPKEPAAGEVAKPTLAKHPAIIYTHGNGELIDDWLTELRPYREVGCYVVLVEFPGYGRSTGKPSEAAIAEVVTRVYDLIAARPDINSTKIVAHGRSMGGGAACLLAARRPVAALILESTFTSIRSMASRMGLPGMLCSDPHDNLQVVTEWKKPLLILHGTRDRVVPYWHGEALAKANPAATFITWQNVDHNDYPAPISRSWPEVRVFLEKAGVL